ncbi:MAG: hypothetical protein E7587_04320 [Ruminococcaceae bacterium]|nr:hypothetical protein [Oscillospiraceae bacterium]
MFGYVKPYSQELLVKEYELYRAVYCGVCRAMKNNTGVLSPFTLSYDIVFLAFVRFLITEEAPKTEPSRCLLHCTHKRLIAEENETLVYCAKVSALLGYGKLKDDLTDSGIFGKLRDLALLPVLLRAKKLAALDGLGESIFRLLEKLSQAENENQSGEAPADLFGEILGEIFSYGLDKYEGGKYKSLSHKIGYHMGRFIYYADASEDFARDCKKEEYNPYRILYGDTLTDENKKEIKTSLMLELDELSKYIELLPYGQRSAEENIIKNTVYFGMPKRISFLERNSE